MAATDEDRCASGVGGAAAKTGDGFFFVRVRGDGVDQAGELQDFADVSDRVEELQPAAVALEGDEGAHERADPGAVHLRDAGEIDDDVADRSLGEAAQLGAQRVVAGTDGEAALQIENRDDAGFARGNLKAHVRLLCRLGARKFHARAAVALLARQNGAL